MAAATPANKARNTKAMVARICVQAFFPEEDMSSIENRKYGRNRLAEGKLPLCAEMCSTKALLAGDGSKVSDIFRERVTYRGAGAMQWGWGVAYDKPGVKGTRSGG